MLEWIDSILEVKKTLRSHSWRGQGFSVNTVLDSGPRVFSKRRIMLYPGREAALKQFPWLSWMTRVPLQQPREMVEHHATGTFFACTTGCLHILQSWKQKHWGQWTLHPLGMTEAVIKEMWREPFLSRHKWGMSLCESLSLIASIYPDVQVMLILYTEMVKWSFFSCLLFDFLSNWVHTCMYMTHVYMFKAQLKNHKTVTPNRNLVSLTWLQAQFKHRVDFLKNATSCKQILFKE